MGSSSSCKTFETFNSAKKWIAQKKQTINHVIPLLVVFLIITQSQSLCQDQFLFLDLCSYLGTPIAPETICGPATTLSFAEIKLDSVSFKAPLPLDKIDDFCPVQIILVNLRLRGGRPGPLFHLADGSSISRAIFIDKLFMTIRYCNRGPYIKHTYIKLYLSSNLI